jgi:hypothetical protein
MHGSYGIRRRSLLKEGIDGVLMHAGLEKILELREDLI